ncbi:MAG: end-binding protein Ku [Bryobacterales bacterium]|nr:end-binding protein Ku [Bryobacterales bacterium]
MPAIVWKGFLSFGLVSFPVRLYSAARPDHIRFNMLHRKDLSRIKEVWYCAEENKPVDRSEIVKGYQVSKGEYVVVEDEELKKIAPPTATTMEILQFVPDKEVDPIYLESSYYVAPDEAVSKPYVLFLQALAETQYNAIAKVTMHNREHAVLIRAANNSLLLHTLFYPNEIRAANQPAIKPGTKAAGRELALAKDLIQHLAGHFKPEELHDTYRENVERLIEQKRKGQKITSIRAPRKAPVVDLMEALKRSLESTPAKGKAAAKTAKAHRKHKAA